MIEIVNNLFVGSPARSIRKEPVCVEIELLVS